MVYANGLSGEEREFFDGMRAFDDAWIAIGEELAAYYRGA